MEDIQDSISELKNIFEEIKKMGWIRSKRTGSTGIGYTFETLMNISENSLSVADFKGIEIKTKRESSNGYITLFSCVPDGDYLFVLNELYENFGYPNKEYPNFKSLNVSIFANLETRIGYSKKFKLAVNEKKKKIYINAYNIQKKYYNNNTSWSFELIKTIIERKIKYLAYIKAYNKNIDGIEYFKYHNITFYKFKNFQNFILQIKKGKIRLSLKIGINKTKEKFGRIESHGCSFDIKEKDLDYIFQKL